MAITPYWITERSAPEADEPAVFSSKWPSVRRTGSLMRLSRPAAIVRPDKSHSLKVLPRIHRLAASLARQAAKEDASFHRRRPFVLYRDRKSVIDRCRA